MRTCATSSCTFTVFSIRQSDGVTTREVGEGQAAPVNRKKRKSAGTLAGLWQRMRGPLRNSTFAKGALVSLFSGYLSLLRYTTRHAPGSIREIGDYVELEPVILALWHGQHLAGPIAYPGKRKMVALFSKSADAELNAMVAERLGFEIVRGSGGRADKSVYGDKGGAKALIQLKRALDDGKNVCMIADIPHGKPRDAGQGIILLASLSGRPILPVAITTSRRKVLERTWDKTTINLPFGRRAVVTGAPIYVPAKAESAVLEASRQELTRSLNEVTQKAAAMVDRAA